MPRVDIKDVKHYGKVLSALDDAGGNFVGAGDGIHEMYVLVSPRQYQVLVDANLIPSTNGNKEHRRGKKPKKKADL